MRPTVYIKFIPLQFKKKTTGENKAERDVWHNTVRATDRKVTAREKASKTIIDLATVINPQTRFKKKKAVEQLGKKKL